MNILNKLNSKILICIVILISSSTHSEPLTLSSRDSDGFPYPSRYCSVSERLSEAPSGISHPKVLRTVFTYCFENEKNKPSGYFAYLKVFSESSLSNIDEVFVVNLNSNNRFLLSHEHVATEVISSLKVDHYLLTIPLVLARQIAGGIPVEFNLVVEEQIIGLLEDSNLDEIRVISSLGYDQL